VEVHSLPSLLHNRPDRIVGEVERVARSLRARGLEVVVGYADCGTYGALDELCERMELTRLPGLHCYDLFAGENHIAGLFDAEPGTYLLTDFLVRTFNRSVVAELGLDRFPELWPDYFGHYRRVVWLAQDRQPDLESLAVAIAGRFGLPLEITEVGDRSLEGHLERLLQAAGTSVGGSSVGGSGTTSGPRAPRDTEVTIQCAGS
jgi:hypothetical protein